MSSYTSHHSVANLLGRVLWDIVWIFLFRPSPAWVFGWRRLLLRCFGGRIADGALVYPSVRVWAPWNLEIEELGCLGRGVNCYCVGRVFIGAHSTVSQKSELCTAGHDIADPGMRLITRPIRIERYAWVASGAFISPGVAVGEGAVVAARACVVKDVPAWTVVGGNPARFIKRRVLHRAKRG